MMFFPQTANKHKELTYQLLGASWHLVFMPKSLQVFYTNRQLKKSTSERVGQLYTTDLTQPEVRVELATLLPANQSSFTMVSFDTKQAYQERVMLLQQGFHFIGFWHTHPEGQPRPSSEDILLITDHAKAAQQSLTGLIFVIVGNQSFPKGLFVRAHDCNRLLTMTQCPDNKATPLSTQNQGF